MTITRYDLGTSYLGGIRKPTSDDVGKFAVVRLDGLDRPNLSYETQVATVADDTFATTLAPFLRGTGLTVDSSGNLRPRARPRRFSDVDHMAGGNAASGSIGKFGWNLLGSGTPAFARADHATAAGTTRALLSTSGSANDRSVLALGETESRGVFAPSEVQLLQFASSMNSVTTSKRIFFGLMADFSQEPSAATACLGIYSDSAVAGGRWQIISRSASAGSSVDTGVAPDASAAELISIWQPTAGTFQFYVGSTLLGSVSTNISTGGLNLGMRLETLAAASKSHKVGCVAIEADLAGALDDDTFLET